MTAKSKLTVIVETQYANNSKPDKSQRIDYNVRESRIWLARHVLWALHNGAKVTTYAAGKETQDV